MTAYYEETQKETEDTTPIERMIEAFTSASGIPWPKHWNGDKPEKWLDPLRAISEATGDNEALRIRAIREAVANCRKPENNILIASPSSILSMALHIIARWKINNHSNDPTPADFLAYRNKLIAMGANVLF